MLLAQEICEIFPTEISALYYKPYNSDGKIKASGTLLDRFTNVKRDMRKEGVLKPSTRFLNALKNTNSESSTPTLSSSDYESSKCYHIIKL